MLNTNFKACPLCGGTMIKKQETYRDSDNEYTFIHSWRWVCISCNYMEIESKEHEVYK